MFEPHEVHLGFPISHTVSAPIGAATSAQGLWEPRISEVNEGVIYTFLDKLVLLMQASSIEIKVLLELKTDKQKKQTDKRK